MKPSITPGCKYETITHGCKCKTSFMTSNMKPAFLCANVKSTFMDGKVKLSFLGRNIKTYTCDFHYESLLTLYMVYMCCNWYVVTDMLSIIEIS